MIAPKLSPNLNSLDSLGGSPPGLKMLMLNIRLVEEKPAAIQDLILDERVDLACITRTWLDEAGVVNLTQLCPSGPHLPLLLLPLQRAVSFPSGSIACPVC